MTTRQSLRADHVAIAVGACSLALILAALGFQYLGGLQPCEMCIWQRWPHFAAALVGVLGGGFLPRRFAVPVAMIAVLLVLTSGFIGLYHALGQYHLVPMPERCSVTHPYMLGSSAVPEVSCNVRVYVLGLVFPAWNAIFSFLIGFAAIVALMKNAPQD
jgi:disulfide bond formation protein DsbB